ncbi:putative rRNA maturation factor [[Clostridium] ultunense Esp]|uniref:Endoribonuclease YbeY n=1 Tax=[Clostridium] ultunense Esp TaxID=1288971 RepID=M1ZG41_9FIRM|nr:rRNA maturation RNase YbeY [Schnuerera ultunensis]CCQ97379.1 putative rRNA maturation factor [[Clostridium] ultunense Esp]SHD77428.1 endonuclease involved in 70S ribosomes quality control [[Clostridium] ultunense Esp]
MELYIDDRQDKVKLDKDIFEAVENAIKETLLLEGKSLNYEISLTFVDNEEIRKLNREYRKVDRETDVLSFPMEQDESQFPVPMLGDIVISAEKTLEQSIEYGHSFVREISYLTVHSMLHLLGYDHMNENEKLTMRNKEKEVMKKLKIFKNGRED